MMKEAGEQGGKEVVNRSMPLLELIQAHYVQLGQMMIFMETLSAQVDRIGAQVATLRIDMVGMNGDIFGSGIALQEAWGRDRPRTQIRWCSTGDEGPEDGDKSLPRLSDLQATRVVWKIVDQLCCLLEEVTISKHSSSVNGPVERYIGGLSGVMRKLRT